MYIYHTSIENKVQNIVSFLSPAQLKNQDLPSKSIIGKLLKPIEQGGELIHNNFIPNPVFVKFMQEVIAEYAPKLTDIQNQAKQQQTGWLYIIDLRRHSSERADPLESMLEDIIGAFRIHDSKIISESYQPIIEHKILSARGFFKIQPELHEHLIEKCFAEVI